MIIANTLPPPLSRHSSYLLNHHHFIYSHSRYSEYLYFLLKLQIFTVVELVLSHFIIQYYYVQLAFYYYHFQLNFLNLHLFLLQFLLGDLIIIVIVPLYWYFS